MTDSAPKPTYDAIWLFDSECVLCDGAVQYTLRHERAPTIRFVSIQSEEGREIARTHQLDPDDPSTFLFIEHGVPLERSDGVIALAGHLSGPARLVRLGRALPRAVRDFAYDLIARNRYRLFGRKQACILPSAAQRARFTLPT